MSIKSCLLLAFAAITSISCAESGKTAYSFSDGMILSSEGTQRISGVYPHLTTYSHKRESGEYGSGTESGIGALAAWGGKLYMVNYAAHAPEGSEHSLYIIDKNKKMTIYPLSVGGTPAARMIHKESSQLLMGHYLIDSVGRIRTIPVSEMPGRITAIARHLTEPKTMAYYYDMEGMLYEVNVNTLAVNKLYNNPLPGWHGKGGYTSQSRLVLSNNGERDWENENRTEWRIDTTGVTGKEKYGALAEFDGRNFKLIERKQYTDITTKNGISAVPDEESPLWAIGWDKRSLRLKVLDNGVWHTYLLPKAANNNDPAHGWFTEWPRIREIGNGEMMMDMHGMFYSFPSSFSSENSAGLSPIASHLRYIPDFCSWNGEIVLASDETTVQGNPLAGQPQSNLWFGTKKEFEEWGPASAYGSVWLKDDVAVGQASDPFLFAGFANRMSCIINHSSFPIEVLAEIDKDGSGEWDGYKTFEIQADSAAYYIYPKDEKGEWIRFTPMSDCCITIAQNYTEGVFNDGEQSGKMFSALADVDSDEPILEAKLFSDGSDFNLSCFTTVNDGAGDGKVNEYSFEKYSFTFKEGVLDQSAKKALDNKVNYQSDRQTADIPKDNGLWREDGASVILSTSAGNLRLPKGCGAFDRTSSCRALREVESERVLANIHGTFYEVPLSEVGKEPLFSMMRPVSSHHKFISDYCSWDGLLVLSGVKQSAKNSNRVFKSEKGDAALWFGAIDDLWKLGKPVGTGGPWKDSQVKKGCLSDPYIMTGYDKKSLVISSDTDVTVTLWLNVVRYLNQNIKYKEFKVKAGEKFTFVFPEGFSAHWASLSTDSDCSISATFIYE